MGKNKDSNISGIVLLNKKSGITSFSSLSDVKKTLKTSKVGHTGTLDSFAEGLLVVLVGNLTRLVPHITNFDKTYIAKIQFGKETDTLDPTGEIVKTGKIPSRAEVQSALEKFKGNLKQIPPLYSALHFDGQRASDLMRAGKEEELKKKIEERDITIYENELLSFDEVAGVAVARFKVSKGTYIRSIARDLAAECGTVAHLVALKRTAVGPFELTEVVEPVETTGASRALSKLRDPLVETSATGFTFLSFSKEIAERCGFSVLTLKKDAEKDYQNGMPIKGEWFECHAEPCHVERSRDILLKENSSVARSLDPARDDKVTVRDDGHAEPVSASLAVFYTNNQFAGIINNENGKLKYGFVVKNTPASDFAKGSATSEPMKILSWYDVLEGKLADRKTALTIGSFDGPHIGHKAIFKKVIDFARDQNLSAGVVTFSRPLTGVKHSDSYLGDIVPFEKRIENIEKCGFDFAIVIDFDEKFASLSGDEFLSILCGKCGMKFLAEGYDFHFGHKGSCKNEDIEKFRTAPTGDSAPTGAPADTTPKFIFEIVPPVLFEGERVSSSRIRACMKNGELEKIRQMLGDY